jgi:hypothetical protein
MPVDETNTTASIFGVSSFAASSAPATSRSNSAHAPATYAVVRSFQPCGSSNHRSGAVKYRRPCANRSIGGRRPRLRLEGRRAREQPSRRLPGERDIRFG